MRNTFTTSLRLNLNEPADRQAWMYLQTMDKAKYRSYREAIVIAVNDYFARQEQTVKEQAFLDRVVDTIQRSLQGMTVSGQPSEPPMDASYDDEDDSLDAALAFANSF